MSSMMDKYRGLEGETLLRKLLYDGIDFTGVGAKETLGRVFASVELKRPTFERLDMTGEIATIHSDTVQVTAETHDGEVLDFTVNTSMIGGRRAGKKALSEAISRFGRKSAIVDEMASSATAASDAFKMFGEAMKVATPDKGYEKTVADLKAAMFEESRAIEKSIITGAKVTSWILDDEATKTIGGKVNYNKKQLGEALAPYIELLDSAVSSVDGFTLTEPRSVTRKGSDDGFSKIPLIGGEKLEGIKAYMGKRDGIIFVFESEGVEGTIEINGADAMDSLEGFEEFVNDAIGFNFMDKVGEMVMTAEALKKTKQVKQAAESYGSEFGAW